MLLRCALLFCVASAVLAAEIPELPEKTVPGMERGTWALEEWGDPGAAEKVTIGERKLLKLIFSGGDKDKTAFKHLTCFGVDRQGKIRLFVYLPTARPVQFALALQTSVTYQWHESNPRDLKQGWNKLEFTILSKDWKTAESKWEFAVPVSAPDEIRAVDLIIYNSQGAGTVLVEALHYDPDAQGIVIAEAVKEMLHDDPEHREKGEKALLAIGKPATEALQQLADSDRPEVLLRAASALRQLDKIKEEALADPKVREQLDKQKEEQRFEESRRRADYLIRGLENQKLKLLGMLKDAHTELTQGRTELELLKHVDVEKRKSYSQTLDKIDAIIKELQDVIKAPPPKAK